MGCNRLNEKYKLLVSMKAIMKNRVVGMTVKKKLCKRIILLTMLSLRSEL